MERLQKVLAAAGLGSRRECEELILQGRVSVDGQIVKELGTKVDYNTQQISCDGEIVRLEKKHCYLFYKPRNCLCTHAPSKIPRVIDFFQAVSSRLFTVGRLDKDSEGLILVTNDGDLAQKLAHPRYKIEKVYRVTVRGPVKQKTLEQLREGLWLSEGKVVPQKVRLIKSSEASSVLEITLTDGKNRAVRRILAKVGHPVSSLKRIRFGNLTLGDMKPGRYRPLQESEWKELLISESSCASGKKTRPKMTQRKKKPAAIEE